ncbi:MAG: hypothetical protein GY715_15290 [Planctomycetes bacterium]|nr:hypothetical protein [Planctomycetota bacterium]
MTTSSPTSRSIAPTEPIVIMTPEDEAADALWAGLCAGCDAPWLDEVRDLRYHGDDVERALDVWSVGLIAALKQPDRREVASVVLRRLSRMPDKDADEEADRR